MPGPDASEDLPDELLGLRHEVGGARAESEDVENWGGRLCRQCGPKGLGDLGLLYPERRAGSRVGTLDLSGLASPRQHLRASLVRDDDLPRPAVRVGLEHEQALLGRGT